MSRSASNFGFSVRKGDSSSTLPSRPPLEKSPATWAHRITNSATDVSTHPGDRRTHNKTALMSHPTDRLGADATTGRMLPAAHPISQTTTLAHASRSKIPSTSRARPELEPPPRPLRERSASGPEAPRSLQQMAVPPKALRRMPSTIDAHARLTRALQQSPPPPPPSVAPPELRSLRTTTAPSSDRSFHHAPSQSLASAALPADNVRRLRSPALIAFPSNDGVTDPLAALSRQQDMRLPTPTFTAHPSSPSTRYSGSPGLWSRTSTPTSMSSHSPALTAPSSKWGPRPRTTSPSHRRPPVAWRGAFGSNGDDSLGGTDSYGLPSLRESLASTSSGSTVREGSECKPSIGNASESSRSSGKDASQVADGRGGRDGGAEIESDEDDDEVEKERIGSTLLIPPPRTSSARSGKRISQLTMIARRFAPSHHSATTAASSSADKLPASKSSDPPSSRDGPPPRPSRDGAPALDGLNGSSGVPVIQSNLVGLPFSGSKRRGSTDTISSGLSAPKKHSATLSSQEHAHDLGETAAPGTGAVRPKLDRAQTTPGPSRALAPSPNPHVSLSSVNRPGKRSTSPHPASPPKNTSRFGFFGRRGTAGSSETETASVSKKGAKKGPVAGTGHEGYGRYALRGRSGSASSANGSWTRSSSIGASESGTAGMASRKSSTSSSKADAKLDEFFLDRLEPVVIVGGSGSVPPSSSSAEDVGPGGSQVLLDSRPSLDSQFSASTEFSLFTNSDQAVSKTSLDESRHAPGALSSTPAVAPILATGEGLNIDTLPPSSSPHLAGPRRDGSLLRMLPPLNTNPFASSSSHDRPAAEPCSAASPYDRLTPEMFGSAGEGHWLKPKQSKRLSPRDRASSRTEQRSPDSPDIREVRVQIAAHPPSRPLPHYAMLDAADAEDVGDLGEIMRDIEEYDEAEDELEKLAHLPANASPSEKRKDHPPSVLLPDPPKLPPGFQNERPVSPRVMLRTPEPPAGPTPTVREVLPSRPSRLPQVGRIPRVVSSRLRKPPLHSFSRPFSSIRPDMVATIREQDAAATKIVEADESVAETQSRGAPVARMMQVSPGNPPEPPLFTTTIHRSPINATEEFLTFPPRKNSEASYSGSSVATSFITYPVAMSSPMGAPEEDEVWKEYDDLLDEVFSLDSDSTPMPFGGLVSGSTYFTTQTNAPRLSPRKQPVGFPAGETDWSNDRRSSSLAVPAVMPASSVCSLLAQRTKPRAECAMSPDAPFVRDHKAANVAIAHPTVPQSASSNGSCSFSYSTTSEEPNNAGNLSTTLSAPAEGTQDSLGSEMNLRLDALMTSRWLSFGRILFSPAHEGIKQAPAASKQERLLILDGLGNDDWSFYCALTYPQAIVYNLSPSTSSPRLSAGKRESGAWQPPPNHRQIHHASFANPFPFPKGFFAAVVFRFPVASSEAAYRNAISECKRVLRPGGYLEISLLDLDMMNMGNRTRRAARELKVRMQAADSSVSLKPASDNILRLLGRRGFENVNRCMLGVPVAGNLATSRDPSLDDGSGPSLSELLRDRSERGDKSIAKKVARVGRWWYSRCYEMVAQAPASAGGSTTTTAAAPTSIWNDRALLRDCAVRRTSFKLLICYAQKPSAIRRRSVSV